MKLVEVLMLMGAHCVSPVEHAQLTTEATKVQCAVVMQKDTGTGTITVTPPGAASDPEVAAAMMRFSAARNDPLTGAGVRIVPAWAPPGSSNVETTPAAAKPAGVPAPLTPPVDNAVATSVEAVPAAAAEAPKAKVKVKVATLAPAPPKRLPAKTATQTTKAEVAPAAPPNTNTRCKGAAIARWYTAADGHRKYRCVRPQPAGDSAPDQLY